MLPAGLPTLSQKIARVVSSTSASMSAARSLAAKRALDAVVFQRVGEERMRSAVKLRRRDDRAAAVGERQKSVGERRLAGGDAKRRRAALERGDAALEDVDSRIGDAAVTKARVVRG